MAIPHDVSEHSCRIMVTTLDSVNVEIRKLLATAALVVQSHLWMTAGDVIIWGC